ncbi:hypothetical protein D3C79_861110 [compost metagenome]
MCQLTHLVRHHRETSARLPCSRSFNGCVERQQIGLLGDAVNHFEDAADGFGLAAQLLHARAGGFNLRRERTKCRGTIAENTLALLGLVARRSTLHRNIGGVAGDFLGGGTQLLDGSGNRVAALHQFA